MEGLTESSVLDPTHIFQYKVNIHGNMYVYHTKMKFDDNGQAFAGFPGGGGINMFYRSNSVTVNDVKHNALFLSLSCSLSINNTMPFTPLAKVVSGNTVIVHSITGVIPEIMDNFGAVPV